VVDGAVAVRVVTVVETTIVTRLVETTIVMILVVTTTAMTRHILVIVLTVLLEITQRITKRHVPIVHKIVRRVNIEVDVEERTLEHAKIVALRLRVRTLRDMEVCRTPVLLLLVRIVQRVSTKAAVAEPVREPARRVRTRHLDSTTHLMVVDPTVVP